MILEFRIEDLNVDGIKFLIVKVFEDFSPKNKSFKVKTLML